MAKKKAVETEAELNMTPMIDVTFQLLIFFLVTLKFKLLEKKLNSYLPTDFGTNATPHVVEENFITVKLKQPNAAEGGGKRLIRRKTKFYVEHEQIIKPTITGVYEDIFNRIDTFRRDVKDAKGKIETGPGIPHGHVVKILDLFHKAKYGTITFTGLAQNKNISAGKTWWNKIRAMLEK